MTPCSWHERLLEAEPVELAGDPGTEIGRHVASCPACRRDAGRILASHSTLDAWLEAHPPFDAAALVTRGAPGHGGRRARRVAAWAPLLAAAAVAGLLLRGPTEPEPLPGTAPAVLAPPDVSAPEGVNFAVLPTADPDITVVWIFQGEG